ncbi:hypothetical protein AB0G04_10405 [Actinoplanes sp. NPDC023801]|uniref:hypothetical protein n=1 Tax=Actinoplanes sp. NPDC023801 TaxID=3154595 RepID=UPI0033C7AEA0
MTASLYLTGRGTFWPGVPTGNDPPLVAGRPCRPQTAHQPDPASFSGPASCSGPASLREAR